MVFSQLNAQTWSQVASILNMFGYTDKETKNLLAWSEGFKDPELTADSVKMGWKKTSDQSVLNDLSQAQANQPYTKTVNGVTWTYTSNGSDITLTIHDKQPNLYRAGYTNNPYASYQVGFGVKEGDASKIDDTKQVTVTLTLVKQ